MEVIDERVKHVGVSRLRQFTASRLREFSKDDEVFVFQDGDEPVAVLMSYRQYLEYCEAFDTGFRAAGGIIVLDKIAERQT